MRVGHGLRLRIRLACRSLRWPESLAGSSSAVNIAARHGRSWGASAWSHVWSSNTAIFYPDALACIAAARQLNLRVGVAGNQPEGLEVALHAAGLEAGFIGSSVGWEVTKPNHDFFARIITEAQAPARTILYVGDRLHNDVLPAHRAGMRTAHIRRGPWGYLHARREESDIADVQIDSLHELASLLK
jgi:FMN phosphatase YigB (HAD superfamily)